MYAWVLSRKRARNGVAAWTATCSASSRRNRLASSSVASSAVRRYRGSSASQAKTLLCLAPKVPSAMSTRWLVPQSDGGSLLILDRTIPTKTLCFTSWAQRNPASVSDSSEGSSSTNARTRSGYRSARSIAVSPPRVQ